MAYLLKLGDYEFPDTMHPADRSLSVAVPTAKLARAQGARELTGYLNATRLVIRGGILGPGAPIGGTSSASFRTAVDALRAALMDTPARLWFGEDDRYYRCVQLENEAEPYEPTHWDRILAGADINLVTGDPYRYATAETTDATWTPVANGDEHALTVGGNAFAAPTITFTVSGTGTVAIAWSFENQTTGQTFTIGGNVLGGSEIAIDCLLLTSTVDTTDTPTLFDGEFLSLLPGANTLKITITTGGCSAISIAYRDRWW